MPAWVASITPAAARTSKVTFKDAAPAKRCEDTTDIESFDGAIESTRVIYKQACADATAAKIAPFAASSTEVAKIKPGEIVIALVATASAPATPRRGVIVRVLAGDKIVQLGPDRFVATTGDPLKKL